MTTPVKLIAVDATVSEAERAMTTYGVNVLPVKGSRSGMSENSFRVRSSRKRCSIA